MSRYTSLSPLQERFVEEYLKDLNATAAYQRAGYRTTGLGARVNAAKLLTQTNVAHAITAAKAARSQRTQIEADRVLEEYIDLALSDMRAFATWGPEGVLLKASETLDAHAARAVQEVVSTKKTRTSIDSTGAPVVVEEVQTRIKLYNKQAALRDLAEHLNLFGVGKDALDEQFLVGFIEVVKQHADADETRQAIIGYLRHYLGAVAA